MDLNTAADILIEQESKVLIDHGDMLVHQLEDNRILIQKGELCFLIERDGVC